MLVNAEQMKAHFDGDEELISELLEIFAESYPVTLEAVKTAMASKNYSDMELHAHTMKGMIANFFAAELKDAAATLETMAREKSDDATMA